MKISPKRVRSSVRMTARNCHMLSLAEAVRREQKDGFFPMNERSEDGGFEGSDNNLNPSDCVTHLSKVETALRGIDLAGKTLVAEPDKSPDSSPAPASSNE